LKKIYNKNYQSKENKKIFQVSRLLTAARTNFTYLKFF